MPDNKTKLIGGSLPKRKQDALVILAEGNTFVEAAKKLKIDRVTLWQWRKDEEFARALREIQSDALAGAIGILKTKAQAAAKALAEVATTGRNPGRVAGARAVIDFAFKGIEFEILDEQIRKLEEAQAAKP